MSIHEVELPEARSPDDGNDMDGFNEYRRERRAKKREKSLAKLRASGLVFQEIHQGQRVSFSVPRVTYFPICGNCHDHRTGEITKIAVGQFVAWMKASLGNEKAESASLFLSRLRSKKMCILDFGKHSGESIQDVPEDYLLWVIQNFLQQKWVKLAVSELARRQALSAK